MKRPILPQLIRHHATVGEQQHHKQRRDKLQSFSVAIHFGERLSDFDERDERMRASQKQKQKFIEGFAPTEHFLLLVC